MENNNKNEHMAKPKKRRTGEIITAIILCAVLIIGSTAAYAYKDEIAFVIKSIPAMVYAVFTPEEEAAVDKEENDKKANELLGEIAVQTMRDLTDAERAMLASGKLSREEALALIRGETLPPKETTASPETTEALPVAKPVATEEITVAPSVTTAPEAATTEVTTSAPTVVTTVPETTEVIDPEVLRLRQEEIIAEIYLLRSTYLNEIDKIIREAKVEYMNLPEEEHTLTNKMKIAQSIVPKGHELEDQCDAQMEELLTELTDILEKLGESTAIVEEIKKTYDEQKKLKKSELYDEYLPKMK